MTSVSNHDAFIDHLVANALPVRRLWSPSARLLAWVAFGFLIVLYSAYTGLRPDVGERLRDAGYLLEVGSLFTGATFVAALSLVAAVPGRGPGRGVFLLAMLFAAGTWLVPIRYPAEMEQSVGEVLGMALGCERRTTMLALPPVALLMFALRRGAPVAGAMSGSLAGAAAFLLASANMRLICPADSCLHLIVGHALPAVAGIAVSAVLGMTWLRRWRTLPLVVERERIRS